MDEVLLREFDSDEEVQKAGRSAVLRRIVSEYIDRRRRISVANQYRRAYGAVGRGLREDFEDWENEGVWPRE